MRVFFKFLFTVQYRKRGVDRKAKDAVLIESPKTNFHNFPIVKP